MYISIAAMKQPLPGKAAVLLRSLQQELWPLSSWCVFSWNPLLSTETILDVLILFMFLTVQLLLVVCRVLDPCSCCLLLVFMSETMSL